MSFRGSQYVSAIDGPLNSSKSDVSVKRILLTVLSAILGIAIVFTGSPFMAAYAEDGVKEANEKIAEEFKESGLEGNNQGFEEGLRLSKGVHDPNDDDTFNGVLARLFSMGYINKTPKSYPDPILRGSGDKNSNDANCDPNDPRNGTLAYHNCDIPNFMTEVTQTLVAQISSPTEPVSATNQVIKSRTPIRALGLPSTMPSKGVPSDPSERNAKYTGLELYGYGLMYTSYAGEWDHVKTLTSARLMTNFGLMDGFAVAGNTISSSLQSGADGAASNASEKLSKGDVIGAAFGFVTGFYEGAISGGIHSIVDTSERNIFTVDGWYRPGFGSTLYNGRERTDAEIAALAQASLLDYLVTSPPPGAVDVEAVLAKGQTIMGAPYVFGGGGIDGPNPGIDCSGFVLFAWSALGVTDLPRTSQGQFDALEGNEVPLDELQPGDLLFYAGDRRGSPGSEDGITHIAIYMGDNKIIESNRGTSQPDGVQINELNTTKKSFIGARRIPPEMMDESKVKEASAGFRLEGILEYLKARESEAEWSKPYKKYMCFTANGGRSQRPAYSADGTLNSGCLAPLRPPVQGGLFGSGYDGSGYYTQPVDTRRVVSESSFMGLGLGSKGTTYVSNIFLFVTTVFVQLSNIALNFSFSPPLATLGLTDIVISAIEGFRDSIFFPLATLLAAGAALMSFYNAGIKKRYRDQLVSLGLIAATFISGVAILAVPERTVNALDRFPAMIEATIIGTLYDFGSSDSGDNLCTATGDTSNDGLGNAEDLDGITQGTNSATRTIMCENWRAFAFNPWVHGQWGTAYKNLYANGYAPSGGSSLTNTNENLVGNAAVEMGGNVTENNWALYQLDALALGTTTEYDFDGFTQLNPDFFRLVDVQAGPNNGAASDGRYLKQWSGLNGSRMMISGMSMVVAGFSMVTVITYSFAKIAITLSVTLLFVMMPLIFAMAILPIFRSTLKAYAGAIISLTIQRIFYVFMLAVLFIIIIGLQDSVDVDYFSAAITSILICILFMMYRKEIFGLIQKGTDNTMGSFARGSFYNPVEVVAGTRLARRSGERVKTSANSTLAANLANLRYNKHKAFTKENRQATKEFSKDLRGRNSAILQKKQFYRGVPGVMVAGQARAAAAQKISRKYTGKEYERENAELAKEYSDPRNKVFGGSGKTNGGYSIIRSETARETGSKAQHIMATVDESKLSDPDRMKTNRRGARLTEAANRESGDLKPIFSGRKESTMVRHNRKVLNLHKKKVGKIDRDIVRENSNFNDQVKDLLAQDEYSEFGGDLQKAKNSKNTALRDQFYAEYGKKKNANLAKVKQLEAQKNSTMKSILNTERVGIKATKSVREYHESISDSATRKAVQEENFRKASEAVSAPVKKISDKIRGRNKGAGN